MAEDFTLDLDYKSTFNKHHPKLNQKQLELQYKKEWLAYKSSPDTVPISNGSISTSS